MSGIVYHLLSVEIDTRQQNPSRTQHSSRFMCILRYQTNYSIMKIAIRNTLILALLICYSCNNVDPFDIEDVDFGDPEIGVPLVNSTFYISDIGVNPDNNTEVVSDSEGRVTLVYKDDFNPIGIKEVFPKVEDQQVSIFQNNQAFNLPFHNIDIRAGVLKNTNVHFEMRNPFNQSVTVVLSIPEIINNSTNSPYLKSYTIDAGENFRSPEEDLSGYTVSSENGELVLSYSAVTSSNVQVALSDINIDFTELDFAYLEGIFSEATLPSTDEMIDISFFDSWVSGGLNLADPRLTFEIENSIGIPAEVKLNSANITTIDDATYAFESDLLSSGAAIDYPTLGNVDGSENTTVEFTSDNSNVADLFTKKPKAIDYDLEITIDSDENSIGYYTDESSLIIDATVEVPLHLRANDLILEDQIGFDEIAFDDIEGTGELLMSLRNGFPIGVGVNLLFLDDNGEILFSLKDADDWIRVDANVDESLSVEDLEAQVISIPIEDEDVFLIPAVRNVLMRVLVTTTDTFADEYVWVYDHHGIEVKLGAVIK